MQPLLTVRFYTTLSGREPVREWLRNLSADDRKTIGTDIKTVQYGWPIGMPLVRKMVAGLWEVRIDTASGGARVLFTVIEAQMVLLHAFPKSTQKTPKADLAIALTRLKEVPSMTTHIGSNFDDLLRDDGVLEEVTAIAVKRVIAWQITEAMKSQGINKTDLAGRMKTSRAQLNRLLDDKDTGLTLDTLSRAAQALGCRLSIQLTAA